jgi:hypothetical protein
MWSQFPVNPISPPDHQGTKGIEYLYLVPRRLGGGYRQASTGPLASRRASSRRAARILYQLRVYPMLVVVYHGTETILLKVS